MNYFNKKSVEDVDIFEKTVILRCDFNVPLDANGNISNTKRIDESLKTIKYLQKNHAKIIIVSHLGRPNGSRNLKFSLKPIVSYISQVLNVDVTFVTADIRKNTPEVLRNLVNGDIAVLENIRFYKEETQNDKNFAKKLASFADIYVNDAFGTAHRAHASTCGIAKFLPAVCGFLMKKEISNLNQLLSNPKRPFVAILGGAKISDKIGMINNLLKKVDTLIVAGGMAYTFLNALGYSVGNSVFEADKVEEARNIIARAKELNVKFVLPVDNVVGKDFCSKTDFMTTPFENIPNGYIGLDIGPKTIEIFDDLISHATTIFANGPVGVFEWENFRNGTLKITQAIANSKALSIVGGGDSSAALDLLGLSCKISHVSTGGGAALEFLEGKNLPGISALNQKI